MGSRGICSDSPRIANPARMGVDGGPACGSLSLSRIPMSSLDWCRLASNMCGEGESLGVPPSDNDLVLVRGDLIFPPGALGSLVSSITATSSISASMSDILDKSSITGAALRYCVGAATSGRAFADGRARRDRIRPIFAEGDFEPLSDILKHEWIDTTVKLACRDIQRNKVCCLGGKRWILCLVCSTRHEQRNKCRQAVKVLDQAAAGGT